MTSVPWAKVRILFIRMSIIIMKDWMNLTTGLADADAKLSMLIGNSPSVSSTSWEFC